MNGKTTRHDTRGLALVAGPVLGELGVLPSGEGGDVLLLCAKLSAWWRAAQLNGMARTCTKAESWHLLLCGDCPEGSSADSPRASRRPAARPSPKLESSLDVEPFDQFPPVRRRQNLSLHGVDFTMIENEPEKETGSPGSSLPDVSTVVESDCSRMHRTSLSIVPL